MRLKGKVALVTGGSRGIGKAIAIALADEGANVIISYLEREEEATNVVKMIQKAENQVSALKCDVRDRNAVRKLIRFVEEEFGELSILVNNAGINEPNDFDQITDSEWDNVLAVNLKGPYICMQEALPLMRSSNGGSIVNIGSVSGQYGGPRTAHYAASKAGLISLSQVVARFAAADNIRCNTIAAGLIESEMAEKGMQSGSVNKAAENIIMARFGSAAEVAKAVVFLASDDSSYITAQTINVNGGLYF